MRRARLVSYAFLYTTHDQVIGKNIADRTRKEVDNAVMAVENWVHDAILTRMDNVVVPRLKLIVRPFTGLSGHGPNSMVQNLGQRDFSRIMENTPLMRASSRTDLNVD